MAKVIGGLFSVEASGQFAKSLVFDKRGLVREYKRPRNAKTAGQGDQRQKMAAITKAVGIVGTGVDTLFVDQAKAAAPDSYRWRPYLLGVALKSATYTAAKAAYDALDGTAQTAWDSEAEGYGMTETALDYAAAAAVAPGEALFILSYAVHSTPALNTGAPAVPGAANAADWADYLVGN